jgi:hypothetical protein
LEGRLKLKRFYSVFRNIKIDGVARHVSVCYPLTDSLESTVEKLVKDGLARVYDEEVRFVSGVPVSAQARPAAPGLGSSQLARVPSRPASPGQEVLAEVVAPVASFESATEFVAEREQDPPVELPASEGVSSPPPEEDLAVKASEPEPAIEREESFVDIGETFGEHGDASGEHDETFADSGEQEFVSSKKKRGPKQPA